MRLSARPLPQPTSSTSLGNDVVAVLEVVEQLLDLHLGEPRFVEHLWLSPHPTSCRVTLGLRGEAPAEAVVATVRLGANAVPTLVFFGSAEHLVVEEYPRVTFGQHRVEV